MKRHFGKIIPALLCGTVIVVVATLQWVLQRTDGPRLLQKLEGMTFDWRVHTALDYPAPVVTNLGVVFIDEDTVKEVRSGRFGFEADLYWPRHVYGRLAQELDAQGVGAIGFDVLFSGYRSTNETTRFADGTEVSADRFFALQMQSAGNVVLAAQVSPNNDAVFPPPMFRVVAWAVGDITAQPDRDGVLRRMHAYRDYVVWNEIVDDFSRSVGFDFKTNKIRFRPPGGQEVAIPIAPDGEADLGVLEELRRGRKLPPNAQRMGKAFTRYRAWNLGITVAAREMNLDLANATVEPGRRIVLRSASGLERSIPIDADGRFPIDWNLTEQDPRITQESFHSLLQNQLDRKQGRTNDLRNLWAGKLAFIGSLAAGSDLRDVGSTPLGAETFLTTSMWNIANSLLTGRFIQRSPLPLNLVVIAFLGLVGAWVTWKSRTLAASVSVLLLAVAYTILAHYAYIHSRYWIPLVLPLAALLFTHFALLTYRVVFEQKERRRIRNVFARMVAPNIVSELLQAEKLSFEGARREVTVFFSDVRGFTALTDKSYAAAEEHVRQHKLSGAEASTHFDAQAQDVLATVNRYLTAIAEQVQVHEGTVDKYIGDCVMAFWGAPTPNPKHAVASVRAAMAAQRAIAALNVKRSAENPLLDPLYMGSGINTGTVNIGLMGSEKNSTYTVFGRDVNLASRLEGLSGRGRIVIGESTFRALQRDDPALAASCRELPPADLKGFAHAVKVYEVPWANGDGPRFSESAPIAAAKTPAA